jgi:polar amino acid transport system substrate-binding protein
MRKYSAISRLAVCLAAAALAVTGCSTGGEAKSSSVSFPDSTQTPGHIRVATTGDSKPSSFTAEGKQQGFDVDVLDAIAQANGYETEYVTMDFSAILATVQNGQADIAVNSISRTPARLKNVDFSEPYYIGYASITTSTKSGITEPPGLAEKRIGFLKGSIYEGYTLKQYPNADAVAFPDFNTAMQALATGTIDGYFGDLPPVQDYIAKNAEEGIVILSKEPVLDLPVAAAIRKGNTPMAEMFNEGLKKLVADGTWQKLYQKWFPDQPVPEMFS